MSGAHATAPHAAVPRGTMVLLVALVAATGVLLAAGQGNIALAFLPLGAAVVLYALWVLPLRVTVLALFATALIVDVPGERPADGMWRSPLYQIGALLFDNLNNVVGVSALRFSGLDVVIGLLLVLLLVRGATRGGRERIAPGANALMLFLAIAFAAVLWIELWGLARGGDFKQSLWQIRPILWLPVLTMIFSMVLRGNDGRVIGNMVIVAACVKAVAGIYVLLAIARPRGLDLPYVTTHSDSVLFASAIALCVTSSVHRPTFRTLVRYGAAATCVLAGIIVNNRRIAFVGLFAALWVIYAVLQRGRTKRAITTAMVALAPVFAVYVLVGAHRTSGIFSPAAKIMSVITQKDASSGTRDIENYNLIITLKPNPVLGTGLGHEYNEVSRAYDISESFAQYRYIGHNSVLWLWSVAGLAGFTGIWLTLTVGVYLARRSYYAAHTTSERITASWILAVVAIYLVQAWGDMGMHGWVVVMILAAALGTAGNLALTTGAWPAGARLLVDHRAPTARVAHEVVS